MSAAATTTRRGAKAARAAEPSPQPIAAFPATRKQESAWLESLAIALHYAANTDEARAHSGESDRLLRVAHELADHLSAHPDEAGHCATVENRAYTIASLIKAALQVPGDTPSADRLAFIEQAWVPLIGLTGDPTVRDGWDTHLRTPSAAPERASEPAPAAARPRDWLPDVEAKAREAAAVLRSLAEDSGTEEIWGLLRLVQWLTEQVQTRVEDAQASTTPFADSSANIACVLSILNLVAEHDDLVLIHAAGSILNVASSFCDQAMEAGHA